MLRAHPAVRDAAVVGRPDAVWGERVTAFVEADGVTEAELLALAAEQLAPYKRPRAVVVRRRAAPQRARQGHQAGAEGALTGWTSRPARRTVGEGPRARAGTPEEVVAMVHACVCCPLRFATTGELRDHVAEAHATVRPFEEERATVTRRRWSARRGPAPAPALSSLSPASGAGGQERRVHDLAVVGHAVPADVAAERGDDGQAAPGLGLGVRRVAGLRQVVARLVVHVEAHPVRGAGDPQLHRRLAVRAARW